LGKRQSGMLLLPQKFGLGLWMLHTNKHRLLVAHTSKCGWAISPAKGSTFYNFIGYLFSARFFRLPTKFGHSIPQPLDSDGHGVKLSSDTD
jgi:hypothetical protein